MTEAVAQTFLQPLRGTPAWRSHTTHITLDLCHWLNFTSVRLIIINCYMPLLNQHICLLVSLSLDLQSFECWLTIEPVSNRVVPCVSFLSTNELALIGESREWACACRCAVGFSSLTRWGRILPVVSVSDLLPAISRTERTITACFLRWSCREKDLEAGTFYPTIFEIRRRRRTRPEESCLLIIYQYVSFTSKMHTMNVVSRSLVGLYGIVSLPVVHDTLRYDIRVFCDQWSYYVLGYSLMEL